MENRKGLLVVVSGPSGVGKGTVCSALRKMMPELTYSVSVTTRTPRPGEIDGVHYYFKKVEQFKQMIDQNELIEWAEYVGNYYGTPCRFVEDMISLGQDVLLEIDVRGAFQVKQHFDEGIFIFLVPPKIEDLRERIENRGTETEEVLLDRLSAAAGELKHMEYYDYVVVNDEVDQACKRIQAILVAEHCRVNRFLVQ